MNTISPPVYGTKLSKEAIYQQLERIFLDPLFINSQILKKFLSFIVDQTLQGNSHQLKEYTIAVNVLDKPSSFKPQDNSIVRIHAGRLRRALNHYYNANETTEHINISVPLGSYVPVFSMNENDEEAYLSKGNGIATGKNIKVQIDKSAVVAIIPFRHLQNNNLENLLSDGLGEQLSTALMEIKKFSVIAYYTMRNVCEKITDIGAIASSVGAQYIVAGTIQSQGNRFRIHIQMIHAHTNQQLWSCMYEGKLTSQNIFEIQDEIIKSIISDLDGSQKQMDQRVQKIAMTAVA
jgi:TolB-like protein